MDNTKSYETLDPENWDEMRALAHRMVDDAITYLETVRERPVWQPIPEEIAARFKAPLRMSRVVQKQPIRNLWKPSFPIQWGPPIHAFGAGTWATGPSSAHWQISWPPP